MLVVGAFLAAPWQIAVSAQAGPSPVVAAAMVDHAGHDWGGHDHGDSATASPNHASDADHSAHQVPCCKGIGVLCPGLATDLSAIEPPGRVGAGLLGLRLALLSGLLPETRPHPPKLS